MVVVCAVCFDAQSMIALILSMRIISGARTPPCPSERRTSNRSKKFSMRLSGTCHRCIGSWTPI